MCIKSPQTPARPGGCHSKSFPIDYNKAMECLCLDPETHFCGFETKSVGVDDQWGEIMLWTCKRCGRIWLRYFIEYEYLTASGRMFTGVIPPKTAARVTVKNAIDTFESMEWYFRGGSAFGGDKLIKTTGPLKPWLTPFPGK